MPSKNRYRKPEENKYPTKIVVENQKKTNIQGSQRNPRTHTNKMDEETQTCPTKTSENHWENQKKPKKPKHMAQKLMKTIGKTKKNQKNQGYPGNPEAWA